MSVTFSPELGEARPGEHSFSVFAPLSLSALVSTILLIMVGSIVRVTGNGLGCPDWPLCHGQAIPPFLLSAWVEFTHRLVGAAVVAQMAILIVMAWRQYRQQAWIFRTAVGAAIVLSVQVMLGGIHVLYELPRWTGWIHTGVAMLVAGAAAIWLAVTWPALRKLTRRLATTTSETRLPLLTGATAAATYLLLLTGSLVTRTGASLVCPAFPNCGLETIPDNLQVIVAIQMIHRFMAFAVASLIVADLWALLRASRQEPAARRMAWVLALLLALQFSLGISNVLLALPMWSRVLHLGTGATIWVFMVILTVVLLRARSQEREIAVASRSA